nr:alanine and arginine-rich domain-containing protein [Dasypus novemcinctus]
MNEINSLLGLMDRAHLQLLLYIPQVLLSSFPSLEMRFQNRQLDRTLLDLNTKMQQLKMEYELEIASESQSLEDNAVNLE